MSKTLFLSTVMAAMLLVPAIASAEDAAPAGDSAPTASATAEGAGEHHEKMMHKKGKIFDEADTNKDGVLSLEEFLERHKQKFAEIDTDKNGTLTRDEMKAYGEEHRAKMKDRREEFKEKHQGSEKAPAE